MTRKTRNKRIRNVLSAIAGVTGFAVTAYLALTAFGGRRGITAKARELMDWESEGGSLSNGAATADKHNDRGKGRGDELQTH